MRVGVADLPMAVEPLNLSNSFVLLTGSHSGSQSMAWGNDEFTRASLTGASSLLLYKALNPHSVAWQIVTIEGADVRRSQTALPDGATVVT